MADIERTEEAREAVENHLRAAFGKPDPTLGEDWLADEADEIVSLVYDYLCRGAVGDLEVAVRLLNDAQTTIIDTDLRHEWEAERARLRSVVYGGR